MPQPAVAPERPTLAAGTAVKEGRLRQTGRSKIPGDQGSLREHNLGVVAGELFSAGQPLSRVELAARTGMTRATVSRLVQDLIDAGIVQDLEPLRSAGPGRPATPVTPQSRSIAGVGVEMNVDYIAGRAIDLAGENLAEFRTRGRFWKSDPAEALGHLGNLAGMMVQGLIQSGTVVAGISVAIPGIVTLDGNEMIAAPNLGWHDISPMELIKPSLERYQVPISVSNDANLQSVCAASLGPGRLISNPTFIYVAGDVGIGGSVVIDGTVDVGRHGWAGELGHICVDPAGRPCFCGSSGCLERYVGMPAILASAGIDSATGGLEELLAALNAGDRVALGAVEEAAHPLGIALASTINLLDISRVILGTGLGKLLPWLEPTLSKELYRRVLGAERRGLVVEAGTGGLSPACTGGALRPLHQLVADPAAWLLRTAS